MGINTIAGRIWRTKRGTIPPAQTLPVASLGGDYPILGDIVRKNGSSVQILASGEGTVSTPVYGICAQGVVDKLNVPGYTGAVQGGGGTIGQPATATFGGVGSRNPVPFGAGRQMSIIALDPEDNICLPTVCRGLGAAASAVDTLATTAAIATVSCTASTGAGMVGFVIRIDDELMFVTSSTTATPDVMTVIRGYAGTKPTIHAVGAKIYRLSSGGYGTMVSLATTSGTSLVVGTGQGGNFSAAGTIQIDDEQMTLSSVSTDTLTVIRGVNGTTAATHTAGALVTQLAPDGSDGTAVITTTALTASATSIVLGSGQGAYFPTQGGRLCIEGELIDYTGVSTDTLTGATRGVDGTTAAAHATGTKVYQVAKVGSTYDVIRNAAGNYEVNVSSAGQAAKIDSYYAPDVINQVYPYRVWAQFINVDRS